MSKYYTPNIDEFCSGFEYEIFNEKWIPAEVSYQYSFEESDNKVRVKYLDVDDLVHLGFQLYGENNNVKVFRKMIENIKISSFIEIHYSLVGSEPFVSIFENEIVRLDSCFVKNKHELKFLLNRLNL
jgi:hypothetical protein